MSLREDAPLLMLIRIVSVEHDPIWTGIVRFGCCNVIGFALWRIVGLWHTLSSQSVVLG
jgi:hypothetical protein